MHTHADLSLFLVLIFSDKIVYLNYSANRSSIDIDQIWKSLIKKEQIIRKVRFLIKFSKFSKCNGFSAWIRREKYQKDMSKGLRECTEGSWEVWEDQRRTVSREYKQRYQGIKGDIRRSEEDNFKRVYQEIRGGQFQESLGRDIRMSVEESFKKAPAKGSEKVSFKSMQADVSVNLRKYQRMRRRISGGYRQRSQGLREGIWKWKKDSVRRMQTEISEEDSFKRMQWDQGIRGRSKEGSCKWV